MGKRKGGVVHREILPEAVLLRVKNVGTIVLIALIMIV